jgi:hypothetical protein
MKGAAQPAQRHRRQVRDVAAVPCAVYTFSRRQETIRFAMAKSGKRDNSGAAANMPKQG